MSYQVLARKWRPQDFSSLIGQEAIVTALTNALSERRIAQAYLFSGIRGVGKTTAARLLAKSLNCVDGPTATPCNECTPCREITAGSDLDVIEVDAATYSKVEQVRELTESLRYGPARDRYKVVVLDEIHRLSRQAFDALLKIVEEPPPHLVFVFATTESEAVPATILSRCQEFHFRRVSAETLSRHLRSIAEAEEVDVSDPALHLISRAGEGSVRDSVALLDQLATFGAGTIADEDAARLVGGLDGGLLHGLLQALLSGGSMDVSETVRRLEDEGRDPRQAYTQMLTFTRDALRLGLPGGGGRDGDAPRVELPREDAEALAALAREAGYENLLRLMQQLLASEAMVRRSENGYLALEVAWLRAAELPKLTRVEDLLGGGPVTAEIPEREPTRPPEETPQGGGTGSGGGSAGGGGSDDRASGTRTPAPSKATPSTAAPAAEDAAARDAAPPASAKPAATKPPPDKPAPPEKAKPQPQRPAPDQGAAKPSGETGGEAGGEEPPWARPDASDPHYAAPQSSDTQHADTQHPDTRGSGANRAGTDTPEPASPKPTEAGPRAGGAPRAVSSPGGKAGGGSTAEFLDEVRRRKEALAAHLKDAELRFADGVLRIRHEPGDEYLPSRLSRQSNRRLVDEALAATWGSAATWRLEVGEARPATQESEEQPDPGTAELAEHPRVQAVLDLFDGTIDSVEERNDR